MDVFKGNKPQTSLISTDVALKEGSVAAHNIEIYIVYILVNSKLRKNAEVIDVFTLYRNQAIN